MPENNENEKMNEDLKAMREWLSKQSHLPPKIDDNILKRFLQCCRYSLEKSKKLLDLFYTIRWQTPEIFSNRNPDDPKLQQQFDIIDLAPLPKKTEKNYKLFIYRLNDSDPDKYLYAESLKIFFMMTDIRILLDDSESYGEIPIFDMANLTLRHLTKVSLPLMKKYMTYSQEAHPIRLRQIHVINTAPFLDKCLTFVKPFMKSEVAKLLHFHQPNSTTLFDYIPRELIPKEYGGTLNESVTEIKEYWRKKIIANKEFFTNEERWKVDESKRTNNNGNNNQVMNDMQGSFRSLNID